jgi:hypothetical protein
MDDDAREGLIERVAQRATAVLPTHETVLRVVDEDHDPGPSVSPVIAVIVLVLALALGIALGVITHDATSHPSALSSSPPPTQPPVSPLFSHSAQPSPHRHKSATASPSLSATARSTASSSPSKPPQQSPTSEPTHTLHPQIALSPSSGRQGTRIVVIGTDWPPNTEVLVSYAGRPAGNARVNRSGVFTGHAVANSVLPGARRVTVTDGGFSVTATFNQHL